MVRGDRRDGLTARGGPQPAALEGPAVGPPALGAPALVGLAVGGLAVGGLAVGGLALAALVIVLLVRVAGAVGAVPPGADPGQRVEGVLVATAGDRDPEDTGSPDQGSGDGSRAARARDESTGRRAAQRRGPLPGSTTDAGASSTGASGGSAGAGASGPVLTGQPTDADRPACNLTASSRAELDRALTIAQVNQVVCYRSPPVPGAARAADVGASAAPGARIPRQVGCTQQISSASALSAALDAAAAGARLCVTGDLGSTRLTVKKGGTAAAPVSIVGNGKVRTGGITVEADHVIVDGFQVLGAKAPGISIKGDDITVRNNTVDHPTGGDADGLRFWGTNLRIVHNTITNVNPGGGGAHADCMQTFATGSDSPASQHVLIDGNRCDKIDNQCLIAEGPNSSAGDGSGQGTSSDIVFSNNYCNVGASQATQIDDVTGVKVIRNEITGKPDKAFSFQNKSTGAVVQANRIAEGIGYQVGMDSSSRADYRGPPVGGGP